MAILLALFLFLLPICHAEVGEWKNELGEFNRKDGTCKVNDRILAHRIPPQPVSSMCNDPLFTLFKFCAKQHFYVEGTSMPKEQYSDSVLFLLNGCIQCPVGNAEATVRLLNSLPSGPIFSSCKAEEVLISSVKVRLSPSNRFMEGEGTFALGGIITGRDCGVFGSNREKEFHGVVLEVEHNCGRNRPMILRVSLPPVIVDLIRDRGNYREWDGISLNLNIQGIGWDQRWVDFGQVRPSDFRRHQAQKKPIDPQALAVPIQSKMEEKPKAAAAQRPSPAQSRKDAKPLEDGQNVPVKKAPPAPVQSVPQFHFVDQAKWREDGTGMAGDDGAVPAGVDGRDRWEGLKTTFYPMIVFFGVLLLCALLFFCIFCYCCGRLCKPKSRKVVDLVSWPSKGEEAETG